MTPAEHMAGNGNVTETVDIERFKEAEDAHHPTSTAAAAEIKPKKKMSRRQRRESLLRDAASVNTTAPPADDTQINIMPESEAADSLAGPWQWPLPARMLLLAVLYVLSLVCTLWAMSLNLLVVAPLLLARAPARLTSRARGVAQRPLLTLVFGVMAPVLWGESYGIEFDLNHRCSSVRDLAYALRPGKRGRRILDHIATARRQMAEAGVTAVWVPCNKLFVGVEHRRLIVHHAKQQNQTALGAISMTISLVNIAHQIAANALEFRSAADGRLVGIALVACHGGYCCGTVFAQRSDFSRSGMWASCIALTLEKIVVDGLPVRIFDAGPTYGAQKSLLGLHPLSFGRTWRVALAA